MIKEFGVDPACLSSWHDCRYITSLFGVENGRLIAKYPKKWKKMAYEAAKQSADETELSRIEIRLRSLDNSVLFYSGRPSGNEEKWIVNAINENDNHPFSGIISNDKENESILKIDELDETQEPLVSPRQESVKREAVLIADSISMLFESGNHYKFIDPYLTITDRYLNPLKEFISRIANRNIGVDKAIIELIASTDGNSKAEQKLMSNLEQALSDVIPDGMKLIISFKLKDQMHDRWILNEWGGAQFGHGFGEGDNPENVNVSLLEEAVRNELWDQYT